MMGVSKVIVQFTTTRSFKVIAKIASGAGFGIAFGVCIGCFLGLILGSITTFVFAPYFSQYDQSNDPHSGYRILSAPIGMSIFLLISSAIIGAILGVLNSFIRNKKLVDGLALLFGLLLPAFFPGALNGGSFYFIGYLYLVINTVCACLAIQQTISYVVRV